MPSEPTPPLSFVAGDGGMAAQPANGSLDPSKTAVSSGRAATGSEPGGLQGEKLCPGEMFDRLFPY